MFAIFTIGIILYLNVIDFSLLETTEIDLTNKYVIDDVLLRNPFVKHCDQPDLEEKFDQMNKSCPLPYRTNTSTTGCFCNFQTKTVECIYMNKLNDFPQLVNNYDLFNDQIESKDLEISNRNESATSIHILNWNIDLKCRNFSTFKSFKPFLNLTYIENLDLSSTDSTGKNLCKYYDEQSNRVRNLSESDKANFIYQIGELSVEDDEIDDGIKANHKMQLSFKFQNLTIKNLDLSQNRIQKRIFLNRKNFQLKSNQLVSIESVSLANNLIEKLDLNNIDVCSFKINNLSLSSNHLHDIDFSYLIILKRLDMSKNNLTTFLIDYFNKDLIEQFSHCESIYHTQIGDNDTILLSNLIFLDLSFNSLTALPFGFIKNVQFHQLEMLNVTSNYVKLIKMNDFYRFDSLIYLNLCDNKIDKIESGSFSSLNNLKYLDLSSNLIQEIPNSLFQFTKNNLIETLKIGNNFLKDVPRESFKYLISVKYLYLNDNKFKKVSNFSFGYMLNLLELCLANNEIEVIEIKAFFIDEKSFIGPGLLEKLDLSHNRLENLDKSVFSYLTNLRYLILNNNFIKKIDYNSFYGVNFLITLDLALNKLDKIDFLQNKNFSNLRYLKLAHNNLEYINSNSFFNLKSLKLLDLSSNKIRGLADCAFNGIHDNIKKIILNYNQIRFIKSCAFMIGFRNMRLIQVLFNPLNCTNNCEFFHSIYNPPYSINYDGTECINGAVSGLNCNLYQYEKITNECRKRFELQKCPNSKQYQEFEMREFMRKKNANNKISHLVPYLTSGHETMIDSPKQLIYETGLEAFTNQAIILLNYNLLDGVVLFFSFYFHAIDYIFY